MDDEVGPSRLDRLRGLVSDALQNEMATTAVWYAGKLVTLSQSHPEDVLLLARSYFAKGDYARAARTLQGLIPKQPGQFVRGDTASTTSVDLRGRLLAARCWSKCKKYAQAAGVLEPALVDLANVFYDDDDDDDDEDELDDDDDGDGVTRSSPSTRLRRQQTKKENAVPASPGGKHRSTPSRQLFGPNNSQDTTTGPRGPHVEDDDDDDDQQQQQQQQQQHELKDEEEDTEAPPPLVRLADRVDLAAAACCVVGRAYEALENRGRAVEWLKRALKVDPRYAEALTFLVERKLLSAADEKKLALDVAADLDENCDDEAWRAALYDARLGVHDCVDDKKVDERFEALERIHGLGENAEVLCAKAERAYHRHDARSAYTLTKRVYGADPYDLENCVPVYLASMVELGLAHDLFACAHELVKAYPKEAPAWFAVGCYYLLVGKNDAAQRYFHKAAKLNPRFAPAWIGFGNAFAAQDESEQAMAAYRSASRLFQGSHLPLMFIGMEYLRTNNLPLAKHFLEGAKGLCPTDPMVSNELGVVDLRRGDYEDARDTFLEVLALFDKLPAKTPLKLACEASIFNLAQTYRKLKDFENAAKYFHLALSLKPRDPAIHAALASCFHVLGGAYVHKAIESYHIALALRPTDTFASEMLTRALKDVLDIDEPPTFTFDFRPTPQQGQTSTLVPMPKLPETPPGATPMATSSPEDDDDDDLDMTSP